MVDFMEQHREMAVGYIKSGDARMKSTRLWDRLSIMLNAEGPPVRTAVQWKKVWADYKVHLKAKMRKNKTSICGTGGGPSRCVSFTATEDRVIELVSLNHSTYGNKSSKNFGAAATSTASSSTVIPLDDEFNMEFDINPILENNIENADNVSDGNYVNEPEPEANFLLPSSSSRTPLRSANMNNKNNLMEKLLQNQHEFHEKTIKQISDCNNNTAAIGKYLEKIYNIQDKQYRLNKKKMEMKEKLNIEKMRRHKQKLEFRQLQINLKERKLEIEELRLKNGNK